MTKDETLKLALEALDIVNPNEFSQADPEGKIDKAITAIKKALAQPETPQRNPLGLNELEVSVRANLNGVEFAVSKRWAEAWALRDLNRIIANDIHTIRNQINEAAFNIKEKNI